MHMNMIFADNTFQDFHILRITDLLYQVTATLLNIAFQNLISIFGNPNHMRRQPRHRMATSSLFITHSPNVRSWVATESLALKVHSFN